MIIPYRVDVPCDRKPIVNWLIIIGCIVVFGLQINSLMQAAAERQMPDGGFDQGWNDQEQVGQWQQNERGQEGIDQQQVDQEQATDQEPDEETAVEETPAQSQVDQNEPNQEQPNEGQTEQQPADANLIEQQVTDQTIADEAPQALGPMGQFILNGWKIRGLFGHMWLHGDPLHLLGNLWFLLVFGNAVCSKVGNRYYFPMYVLFGLGAAVSHLAFTGGGMLGASGAIYGVIGMFLVFFPENEVSCLWIMFLGYGRRFSVSSYWIILMWVVFDVALAILMKNQVGGVAYCAHIGGFVTGLAAGIVMVKAKWVTMENYERSLLELIGIEKRDRPNHSETTSTEVAFWEGQIQAIEAAKPEAEPKAIPLELPIPVAEPEPIAYEPAQPKQEFIRFACPCGKKIKVPALYAGKTGRCPRCGCDVEIPKQKAVEPQAAVPQTDRPTAEFIRFVCPCGKRVKVPAAFAGKSGRCPKCGSPLKIP